MRGLSERLLSLNQFAFSDAGAAGLVVDDLQAVTRLDETHFHLLPDKVILPASVVSFSSESFSAEDTKVC